MRRVIGIAALFLATGPATAQFPGGGPPDPEAIWGFISQGKDSINLNERTDIRQRMQDRGSPIPPDGILTKAAFVADMQQRIASGNFGGGGGGGRGGRGGGGGGWGDLEARFRQSDTNGDGRITLDEANDRLKPNFAQADKNGDGAITLDEYKQYMAERMANRGGGGGPPGGPPGAPDQGASRSGDPAQGVAPEAPKDEPVVRPTVYRYGKLPKELPAWFAELDEDQDGQVGLYEWRKAGKPMTEFVALDQNGDGYLTADEWLRQAKAGADKKPADGETATVAVKPAAAPAGGGNGRRGRGGRGGAPAADGAGR